MLNKRHRKRRHYLVHVTAKTEAEICLLKHVLAVDTKILLRDDVDLHFHTFEVSVSPSALRRILDTLPRTICVSYEEIPATHQNTKPKKPESC